MMGHHFRVGRHVHTIWDSSLLLSLNRSNVPPPRAIHSNRLRSPLPTPPPHCLRMSTASHSELLSISTFPLPIRSGTATPFVAKLHPVYTVSIPFGSFIELLATQVGGGEVLWVTQQVNIVVERFAG